MPKSQLESALSIFSLALLSTCSLVKCQPVTGIGTVDLKQGHRLETNKLQREDGDDTLIVVMSSDGGTRATTLGYGVLEQLNQQRVTIGNKRKSLLTNVDVIVGVSDESVLTVHFTLRGEDTIPLFYERLLHQDFQRQVIKQAFPMSNLPRLTPPEYGRRDLSQEQFENYLFGEATFRDLEKRGKGPFIIVSAADMGVGERFSFTQEYLDPMRIDLGNLRITRTVAASSSVPMVLIPIALNNNGGRCNYMSPIKIESVDDGKTSKQQGRTVKESCERFQKYVDRRNHPYVRLMGGGLTNNLGMCSLLDMTGMYPERILTRKIKQNKIRHIVVINVNVQNQISSSLDKTVAVPDFRDIAFSIVNIPVN